MFSLPDTSPEGPGFSMGSKPAEFNAVPQNFDNCWGTMESAQHRRLQHE